MTSLCDLIKKYLNVHQHFKDNFIQNVKVRSFLMLLEFLSFCHRYWVVSNLRPGVLFSGRARKWKEEVPRKTVEV